MPAARRVNLPVPLTPFVGRVRELGEIVGLLTRPEVRLLVLTGPGGTGKTRLALAAADQASQQFEGGASFVGLAPVRDPDGLLPAIAAALDVREAGERPVADVLTGALADREMLIILDNFEQIALAAPRLIDLLSACPGLTLLVTSRVVLNLTGEFTYPVSPLSLSEATEEFEPSEAVALFQQRAGAALPGFALDETNRDTVHAICERLDGLPLAIELAAARLRHLPLNALRDRLDRQLNVLSYGPRDQPSRLRTMRDAIAWSYDLLPPDQQSLFRHVSVFAGGFTLDAAMAVADSGDELEVLDALASLIDSSLLLQRQGHDGSVRYRMLEVIREYAGELLEASGDASTSRRRMVDWCIDVVRDGWPAMAARIEQDSWLARYDAEMPNFRMAMTSLEEWRRSDELIAMTGGLFWYWYVRGQFTEGRAWLSRALNLASGNQVDPWNLARATYGAGILAHFQGDDEEATNYIQTALAAWERLDDEWGQGICKMLLGIIAEDDGHYDPARVLFEQSIQHAERAGDDVNHALATYHLGIVHWGLGDLDAAIGLCRDALERQRAIGDRWGIANSLACFGTLSSLRGNLKDSLAAQQESLRMRMAIGTPPDTEEIANYLANMSVLAVRSDQPALAAHLFGAEQRIRSSVGTFRGLPERLVYEDASARARNALGDSEFDATWSAGYAAPVEASLEMAMGFHFIAPDGSRSQADGLETGRGARLTPREREVLQLMALGLTNAEIAGRLYITPGTVRIHVSSILGKVGARTRTEAVAIARQQGDLTAT